MQPSKHAIEAETAIVDYGFHREETGDRRQVEIVDELLVKRVITGHAPGHDLN